MCEYAPSENLFFLFKGEREEEKEEEKEEEAYGKKVGVLSTGMGNEILKPNSISLFKF